VDLLFAGREALLAGQQDLLLEQGGGFPVAFGQRRQVFPADAGRQAGQQQPGASAAVQRERLARLERDAQLLRGLDPVHADRRPADQADQDDGLTGLSGQVLHDGIGHVDDGFRGLRRPGQADEPGREPVAAAFVPGQQPGLAQQRNVAVDAGQRDAGAFGQLASGEGVLVGGEREHQGEDAAGALTPMRGIRLRRHFDRGSLGH
jgi:hypothetical protein